MVMRPCSRVNSIICRDNSGRLDIIIFSRSIFFSNRRTCSDNEFRNKIFAAVNQTQDLLSTSGAKFIVRGLDEDKYPDSFAEDTLAYANDIDADLIMIMTQQEKGFSEYLLGSYAQQIVNHAGKIPIMCIQSSDKGVILDGGLFS